MILDTLAIDFQLFISFYFCHLIIIMTCAFFLLLLTSYYAILAYCVLYAVIWVGGVDVYNVDGPLFACAYVRGHTCVCPTYWMPA